MSRYLVDQIEAKSNVRVWSGCEVRSLEGDEKLEAVVISGAGPDHRVATSALFAMIGASPRSEGLVQFVGRDDKRCVVTGEEARRHPTSPPTGTGWTAGRSCSSARAPAFLRSATFAEAPRSAWRRQWETARSSFARSTPRSHRAKRRRHDDRKEDARPTTRASRPSRRSWQGRAALVDTLFAVPFAPQHLFTARTSGQLPASAPQIGPRNRSAIDRFPGPLVGYSERTE